MKWGGIFLQEGRGADFETKCENGGSCLKHPLEEELQWDRADGSEGADLNSLKQTGFLSEKRPAFLTLGSAAKHANGGACSVSLSVGLLLALRSRQSVARWKIYLFIHEKMWQGSKLFPCFCEPPLSLCRSDLPAICNCKPQVRNTFTGSIKKGK